MRAVVQRVSYSDVSCDGVITGKINNGLSILVGVEEGDTEEDASYICDKCAHLRIFDDSEGKLNLSVLDVGGGILAISQFTLLGDCRKGRRPNFMAAEKPEFASYLFNKLLEKFKSFGIQVETGVFQSYMLVKIENDGPVTLLLDSRKNF